MPTRPGRRRLTLASLLGLVALAALAMAGLRALRPPKVAPPADSALYENATASRNLRVRVGANLLSLAGVARNAEDGTLRFEDGRGKASAAPGSTAPFAWLTDVAPWADAAEVRIAADPARLEVIEHRVFDGASRRSLGRSGYATSAAAGPSVVRLQSLNDFLPDTVDVWFRAASHPPGETIVRLGREDGASSGFAKGTLSVREVRPGAASYTMTARPGSGRLVPRWASERPDADHAVTAVFDWEGDWVDGRYQVVAVAKDGRKAFPGQPHYLDFRGTAATQVVMFGVAPDALSHFEWRPFGGRHTFYFQGVKLPGSRPRSFAPPPACRVAVNGAEGDWSLSGFGPSRVRVRTRRGNAHLASSTYGRVLADDPQDAEGFSTVLLDSGLLTGPDWDVALFGRDGTSLGRIPGGHMTSGASGAAGELQKDWCVGVPLDRIGSVEVRPTRGH